MGLDSSSLKILYKARPGVKSSNNPIRGRPEKGARMRYVRVQDPDPNRSIATTFPQSLELVCVTLRLCQKVYENTTSQPISVVVLSRTAVSPAGNAWFFVMPSPRTCAFGLIIIPRPILKLSPRSRARSLAMMFDRLNPSIQPGDGQLPRQRSDQEPHQ